MWIRQKSYCCNYKAPLFSPQKHLITLCTVPSARLQVINTYIFKHRQTLSVVCILQGDGTALIFQDNEDVFTFSVHCGVNFPLHKQQSDQDVSLEKYVRVSTRSVTSFSWSLFWMVTALWRACIFTFEKLLGSLGVHSMFWLIYVDGNRLGYWLWFPFQTRWFTLHRLGLGYLFPISAQDRNLSPSPSPAM